MGTIGSEQQGTQLASLSPSDLDLAWAAGFLEGEGCFTYCGHSQQVIVTQNEKDPLFRLQEMFGGSVRPRTDKNTNRWYVAGSRARGVMMTMYNLMGERRKGQIRRALEGW